MFWEIAVSHEMAKINRHRLALEHFFNFRSNSVVNCMASNFAKSEVHVEAI